MRLTPAAICALRAHLHCLCPTDRPNLRAPAGTQTKNSTWNGLTCSPPWAPLQLPSCKLQMWGTPSNTCCTCSCSCTCVHVYTCACMDSMCRLVGAGTQWCRTSVQCKAGSTQNHSQHGSQRLAASAPGVPANAGGALFQRPCYVSKHCSCTPGCQSPPVCTCSMLLATPTTYCIWVPNPCPHCCAPQASILPIMMIMIPQAWVPPALGLATGAHHYPQAPAVPECHACLATSPHDLYATCRPPVATSSWPLRRSACCSTPSDVSAATGLAGVAASMHRKHSRWWACSPGQGATGSTHPILAVPAAKHMCTDAAAMTTALLTDHHRRAWAHIGAWTPRNGQLTLQPPSSQQLGLTTDVHARACLLASSAGPPDTAAVCP